MNIYTSYTWHLTTKFVPNKLNLSTFVVTNAPNSEKIKKAVFHTYPKPAPPNN